MADINAKMRQEFAAWYLASVVEMYGEGVRPQAELNLAWSRDDGSYADPMLRLGLMAWEASRAAVVGIDRHTARAAIRNALPNVPGDALDHGLFAVIEACGLQVAP